MTQDVLLGRVLLQTLLLSDKILLGAHIKQLYYIYYIASGSVWQLCAHMCKLYDSLYVHIYAYSM